MPEDELSSGLQEARAETAQVKNQLQRANQKVTALQYQLRIIREVLSLKVE